MIGLIASAWIIFIVAGLIGFAGGWVLRNFVMRPYLLGVQDDLDRLRRAVGEVQVRRARAL
ncbi:MAG: hypothetical protein ACOYKM_04615 [Caulobacterales bacterium]|jgi:hypothetical protein